MEYHYFLDLMTERAIKNYLDVAMRLISNLFFQSEEILYQDHIFLLLDRTLSLNLLELCFV